MDVLAFLGLLALSGFVVGALARLAVPGPDPMPVWLTIVIGLVGSVVGGSVGGIVAALAGYAPQDDDQGAAVGLGAAVVGATVLVVLYRKVIQKRAVTGPAAHDPALPARGLRRIARRRPHRYYDETAEPGRNPAEQLQQLVALRDAGKISPEEFEARKTRLVDAI